MWKLFTEGVRVNFAMTYWYLNKQAFLLWILLVRGKGFHISKLPHGTHIMFSWDYYLDDLCSVITLHVTVQRCSPNINSPILPPHGCERTVKLSFSVTASVVLSQSSHLPCLPNFFALIIDQNGHYFLVNSRVIESCIWFYCF